MNTVKEGRYIQRVESAIQREAHFHVPRPPQGKAMRLRCPDCNSSNLTKVSLAHEKGLFHTTARTRLRGFLLGENGPNIIVGRAITQATHESQLSVRLRPPGKWSYGKVVLWSALFSFGLLVAYIHRVMGSAMPASSFWAVIYVGLLAAAVSLCLFFVWRHNTFFYQRELERWNRSFVCGLCGSISEHEWRE